MCNCTCSKAGPSDLDSVPQVQPTQSPKNLVPIEHEPMIGETPQSELDNWLTPIPSFYVRNHFEMPEICGSEWKLHIDGLVSKESNLSFEHLRALPSITMPVTIECAGNNRSDLVPPAPGNQFQNGAVSTANWTGTSLHHVLTSCGISDGATEVLFEGYDSGVPEPGAQVMPYLRSLPLNVAMHPDTLLVYEMNSQILPREHGFPVRLLVSGWYGMASVKWLKRITVLDRSYEGFFQTDRYIIEDDEGREVPLGYMGIKSVISSPEVGDSVHMEKVQVNGTAWSGGKRIVAVEVSTDGGNTWRPADLDARCEGYAWRQWCYSWTPDAPGGYTLMSRAVDEAGNVQPMKTRWNRLGYMINGVRPVSVQVVP